MRRRDTFLSPSLSIPVFLPRPTDEARAELRHFRIYFGNKEGIIYCSTLFLPLLPLLPSSDRAQLFNPQTKNTRIKKILVLRDHFLFLDAGEYLGSRKEAEMEGGSKAFPTPPLFRNVWMVGRERDFFKRGCGSKASSSASSSASASANRIPTLPLSFPGQ